jgi:hypothetical protein
MVKSNNILMLSVIIMIGFTLCAGCSSGKPPELQMKGIIAGIQLNLTNENVKSYQVLAFDEFQITKGFYSKDRGPEENVPYNIEVNYKIHYKRTENNKIIEGNLEGKNEKYWFVKRGNAWVGNRGWFKSTLIK